jgi:hypothetical protein
MYLVQLLLPIYDNDRRAFPRAYFDQVRHELTHRFGGITAFVRSPAVGLWKEDEDVTRDDVVTFEVMAKHLNDGWWKRYRQKLENSFRPENIVVRALEVTKL